MSAQTRIEKITEYANSKFKNGDLVYLTEAASKELGNYSRRGPYVVSGMGPIGVEFSISVRNLNFPLWDTRSYIESHTNIEHFLTEDEYFIKQNQIRIREKYIYTDSPSDVECEALNKFFDNPELWVPALGDDVAVYTNPYPELRKLAKGGYDFCECQVDDIEYNTVFDIRNLPRLVVEIVGCGGGGHGIVSGISPLHCY